MSYVLAAVSGAIAGIIGFVLGIYVKTSATPDSVRNADPGAIRMEGETQEAANLRVAAYGTNSQPAHRFMSHDEWRRRGSYGDFEDDLGLATRGDRGPRTPLVDR